METMRLFEAGERKEPKMSRMYITPDMARHFLEHNENNRTVSDSLVNTYAMEMERGHWSENTGTAISIDWNGNLADGQHRLLAIIKADKAMWMWVCFDVDPKGTYDMNRKRSQRDLIKKKRPDLPNIYSDTMVISVIKALIIRLGRRRYITDEEVTDYIDENRDSLDGYWLNMPITRTPKIRITTVHTALYLAYLNGIPMADIVTFNDVLCSGMSDSSECFPVIAYRNYLLANSLQGVPTTENVSRCQFALKKYLTKSCYKKSKELDKLIWDFPKENE